MALADPADSSPTAPSGAERVRSTCARANGALLAVERVQPVTTPLHHLMADGSFAVAVPVSSAPPPQPCAQAEPAAPRRCWSWLTTRPFRCANRCVRWCG